MKKIVEVESRVGYTVEADSILAQVRVHEPLTGETSLVHVRFSGADADALRGNGPHKDIDFAKLDAAIASRFDEHERTLKVHAAQKAALPELETQHQAKLKELREVDRQIEDTKAEHKMHEHNLRRIKEVIPEAERDAVMKARGEVHSARMYVAQANARGKAAMAEAKRIEAANATMNAELTAKRTAHEAARRVARQEAREAG